ncbi:MAG: carboxypeptidase regulatory-like domain-containing protein [Terracidiphilus sp.]
MNRFARLILFAAAFNLPVSALAATIAGEVIDRTTNKPATGDAVMLLDPTQGMRESAWTTVDGRGHYSFMVPGNAGMYLIRVEHQKTAYYGPAPSSVTTVNVDVYDVSAKVEGVREEADLVRIETDSRGLHVVENHFVENDSNPPRTQFSKHSFEIYLEQGAHIDGAAAMGPGRAPTSSLPVPLGDKRHYAFVFPIRPGETRFQISYHLPYNGSFGFQPGVSLPTNNLAIMLPKSMRFDGWGFQSIDMDPNMQTFMAKNTKPGAALAYTVSGTGAMPRDEKNRQGDNAQALGGAQGIPGASTQHGQGGEDQSAAQEKRPGGGLGVPINTPDPLQKYKWSILCGLALVLVIAAAFCCGRSMDGMPRPPLRQRRLR